MKISPIRSYYNNINFTSKVKKVINGNVPESVQEQIDIFEETDCANAEKLGEGLFAEAYRINGTDIVIKRSKPKNATSINGDFSQEAHALMNIPKDFQHAQRLIGNVETEYENFYLISTFMEGKIPDGDKIKWDRRSLSSILTSLAQLDTARVFHGDVSRCNCLITEDGEVNLLDFQYCDKFRLDDDYDHAQNALNMATLLNNGEMPIEYEGVSQYILSDITNTHIAYLALAVGIVLLIGLIFAHTRDFRASTFCE